MALKCLGSATLRFRHDCGPSDQAGCLVTLDLDFANPFLFSPADSAGVAVVRLPAKPSAADLADTLAVLIRGLSRSDIRGKLWVVRQRGIREYSSEEDG